MRTAGDHLVGLDRDRDAIIRVKAAAAAAEFVVPATARTQEQATETPGFPLSRE